MWSAILLSFSFFLNTQQVLQKSSHLFCLDVHADVAKGYTCPHPLFESVKIDDAVLSYVKVMLCQIIPIIHDSSFFFGGGGSVSVVTTISAITEYLVLAPPVMANQRKMLQR